MRSEIEFVAVWFMIGHSAVHGVVGKRTNTVEKIKQATYGHGGF